MNKNANIEMLPEIVMPERVKAILDVLHDKGYEAYIVGGCVRDSILGTEPKDWDVCTSARPDEVEDIIDNLPDDVKDKYEF